MAIESVKLKTNNLKMLEDLIKQAKKSKLNIGYTDPLKAEIAMLQEYGSPLRNIEAKPYFIKSVVTGTKQAKYKGNDLKVLLTNIANNVDDEIKENTDLNVLHETDKEY